MNTQSITATTLTLPQIPRSGVRSRRCELGSAAQPSRRQQISGDTRSTATAFERFLSWLGPDPESAGQKYESIRNRLIMMFKARRCAFPEDLADATFERVVRKMTDLTIELTVDPARYFYGVAKKIYLEHQREITAKRWKSESSIAASAVTQDEELENRLQQLDEALMMISNADRELILKYYAGSGRDKINHRRALGEQFGLGPNALRLRVYRIRKEIKSYMSQSGRGPQVWTTQAADSCLAESR
jgi:hypothetical protein